MLLEKTKLDQPYSDEEIETFVSSHLDASHRIGDMVKTIKNLPPEFQIFLLTEGLNTEFASPLDFTQKIVDSGLLKTRFRGVGFAGFCDVQALLNDTTPNRTPDGRIVLNGLFDRFCLSPLFSHELGHRLDRRFSQQPDDPRALISSREDWQTATDIEYRKNRIPLLGLEFNTPERLVPLQSTTKLMGKVSAGLAILTGIIGAAPALVPLIGAVFLAPSIYKGRKFFETRDHMTQYTGALANHRGAEAFAEVTRDYVKAYKKSGGDMAKVEKKMEKIYSKSGLWTLYKTSFLDDFRQDISQQHPTRLPIQSAKRSPAARSLET